MVFVKGEQIVEWTSDFTMFVWKKLKAVNRKEEFFDKTSSENVLHLNCVKSKTTREMYLTWLKNK